MEAQSLWPILTVKKTRSPKSILKEQAGYLMANTGNILSAEVRTQQNRGTIQHTFYIVAPALQNYRYELLSVIQDVLYYPLKITHRGYYFPLEDKKVETEAEFIERIREIFNDQETIDIISSLYSQSLEE
jgi:hypothetical protein